jgi:hypothetical protein
MYLHLMQFSTTTYVIDLSLARSNADADTPSAPTLIAGKNRYT